MHTPNYDSWAHILLENTKKYADKHGYKTQYKRIPYPEDRHPSWYRVPCILEAFNESSTDWVFWSDIDSLIMQHPVKLEDFIIEDKNLILNCQGEGAFCGRKVNKCLNMGQFFIKKSDWSISLLNAIWEWPDKYDKKEYLWGPWWENDAFNYFWENDILEFQKNSYVYESNRCFNSFYELGNWNPASHYKQGDFIVHFSSQSEHKRESLIKKMIKDVQHSTNDTQ